MGGLRALCCSKGDKADESQLPPARLAQLRLEKSTENAPPSAKKETSSTDMTPMNLTSGEPAQEKSVQQNPVPRDLWKEAFDNLDPSRQPYVAANGMSSTSAIDQVIKDTTAKYEQWQKGGLKIRQKDGDDIIFGIAQRGFSPQIVQNRLDRRDAIFAASEYLAETLSYYTLIDTNYRNQKVPTDHNLDQALLRVYSAILDFTVEVKKGRDENEASKIMTLYFPINSRSFKADCIQERTFQSFMALTDQPLQILKDVINSQAELAKKWTELAANLGDRQRAAEHLAKTDALLANMKNLASKALTAEEESQLVWMSAFPYSDHQRALQKKRTGDTGLWLLDTPKYNDWKTTPGSLLWLPGISGCGKSVLCSTLIQDIEEDCSSDPSKFLGYWYFQFDSEATKNVDTMCRSLIRQLSRSPLTPDVIKIWEEHHLKGSQPDSKAISGVLHDLLSAIRGDIYLVFDALDECPENERSKERGLLLSLLEDLLERHSTKIHILATSRPEPDIQERLEQFSKINLEAHLAEDVKTFVTLSCTEPSKPMGN
ncbi:uncharacterized protein N7469_002053 [Penicillium citrinum]|uniref:NACHT domain-containing protein n=1 Tax=Penicillium citrinum TaxID=5077 RepID=A0A9W9PCP4_PENCI|nr:uncharacterized protein N7469_002053 [Penicillium citrinum]KAJ5240462.1 hypothetical protein N7469_002053 [Penicillium citrinum]